MRRNERRMGCTAAEYQQCRAIIGMACSVCCAGLWLGVLTVTLVVLYGSTQDAMRQCHGKFGPLEFLHRGNLTHAQENTVGSVVAGSAALGANPEVDVMTTRDNVAVLHNDETLQRMTGSSRRVEETWWWEVSRLTVSETIDGYDYGSTSRIASLNEVLLQLCSWYPSVVLDFDIKSHDAAREAVYGLRSSACTAKDSCIFSTALPTVGITLANTLKQEGMANHVSIYLHPGQYGPLGLYFFLKTGIFQYSAGVSMIALHKVVWDKEEEDIRSYEEYGYCTGIYGLRREEMWKYPGASYYVLDEGPSFPDTPNGQPGGDGGTDVVEYDGSRTGYYGLLAMGILCFPLLIVSTLSLIFFIRRVRRAKQLLQ